jgi:hypothetical protein
MDELGARLSLERRRLLKIARLVPDDKLWEGEWSCGHILAHIPSMERWLASGLIPTERPLEFVNDQERDRRSTPLLGSTMAVLMKAMSDQRRSTRMLLAATPDLDVTIGTQWGNLTLRQIVRMIYRHDREHSAQIQSLLVR